MIAERRTEKITLNVSPGFKEYLKKLFAQDSNPHARYVYPAKNLPEYLVRILEEHTGHADKRLYDELGFDVPARRHFDKLRCSLFGGWPRPRVKFTIHQEELAS